MQAQAISPYVYYEADRPLPRSLAWAAVLSLLLHGALFLINPAEDPETQAQAPSPVNVQIRFKTEPQQATPPAEPLEQARQSDSTTAKAQTPAAAQPATVQAHPTEETSTEERRRVDWFNEARLVIDALPDESEITADAFTPLQKTPEKYQTKGSDRSYLDHYRSSYGDDIVRIGEQCFVLRHVDVAGIGQSSRIMMRSMKDNC